MNPVTDVRARVESENSCNCCNNNKSTCCFPFLKRKRRNTLIHDPTCQLMVVAQIGKNILEPTNKKNAS